MTGEDTDKDLQDEDVSDDVSDDEADDVSDDEADDEADDDLLLGDDDGFADTIFADTIIEANVDALFAKIELTDAEEAARKRQARKRLEELKELKRIELDATFNIDLENND